MTVRVFASAAELGPVTLDAEESHYLVRVRRARPGTTIEVLAHDGGGWRAQVEIADAKRAQVVVLEALAPRPPWPIDLAVALPDAKAAAEVIARATESGARSLTFLETEHSQPGRLNPERIERVTTAARRQCGRLVPLPLYGPLPLHTWLESPRSGFIAAPSPGTKPAPPAGPVDVLVCPEGGLHPEEERRAQASGLIPLSLGPYILRTEVAVTAAVAVVGTFFHPHAGGDVPSGPGAIL